MCTVEIRRMDERDLCSAERASAAAFSGPVLRNRKVDPRDLGPVSARWIDRMRFYLDVDPGGCWVATAGEAVIGFAISQNRGRLWYLATYGVVPEHRGTGVGRQLIQAALEHARGRPALFSSTVHPAATRRYRIAGFSLHPQMRMLGKVDRSTLPAIRGLADGDSGDLEWMDDLDLTLRGAGHGPDHVYMLRTLRLIVSRPPKEPGYVYIDNRGQPHLLAAANRPIARKLLWAALSCSEGDTLINCITTANEWAVDVGLIARLDIGQEGYLGLRGMQPPSPYLASGHFL
jgi:GNAT superfamily N-acetyltransferase